jgi:protein-L-isoaspartate(D-aspartate) O-methyltransferase
VTTVKDRPLAGQDAARRAMIDSQLRPSGVNDESVLRRMADVRREDFLPESARGFAYIDRAVALGEGRWLAAPIVQGLMLQEARPSVEDRALVVDGGSGYLAELLRPLVGSLEIVSPASATGKSRKAGAFTLLLVDGAVEQLPDGLVRRLADGARIVTGEIAEGVTRLSRRAARRRERWRCCRVAELGIPALPEFAPPKAWSF